MGLAGFKAAAPLIGMLGGPLLSGLFEPDGQEMSSFEGKGAIDPVNMLSNVNSMLGRVGQATSNRAASPVSLPSSYVQQPGVYSGGGLPMPIGLTGSDPALADPSLLSLQGLDQYKDIFSGMTAPGGPDAPGGFVDPDGYHRGEDTPKGDRIAVPRAGAPSPPSTRRRAYGQPRASGLSAAQGSDDMEQGLAAARLLLQNLDAG